MIFFISHFENYNRGSNWSDRKFRWMSNLRRLLFKVFIKFMSAFFIKSVDLRMKKIYLKRLLMAHLYSSFSFTHSKSVFSITKQRSRIVSRKRPIVRSRWFLYVLILLSDNILHFIKKLDNNWITKYGHDDEIYLNL